MNDLLAYVSPAYRRLLDRGGDAPVAPAAEVFEAVALFADISGFSALTTRLSARGSNGAEELSRILDDRFGRLVDEVARHGGEVLGFAGDAAVAYWDAGREPGAAAGRAVRCAAALHQVVQGRTGSDAEAIRLRVGVGAGRVLCARAGGVDGRWHSLLAGEAWDEMLGALARARPGESVLAPAVERMLAAGDERVDATDEGEARGGGEARFAEVEPPAAAVEARPAEVKASAEALRAGAPRAVGRRIAAGQQDWLAEFLTVTTVFVNVPGLRYDSEARLEELQRVVSTMQRAVHELGGSVNDLIADDKGTVLVAAWGVPMHAYEDNGARAALAALRIREDLRALGIRPAIGITTGRGFAGPVGNARRMRYALVGEPLIFAARLMQAAEDGILCDTVTRNAAHRRVRFGPTAPVTVKGREVGEAAALLDARRASPRELVGREAEERALAAALAAVEHGGRRLVVLRGEPGIGKSTLVSSFLKAARASTVRMLVGSGDSMSQSSPYHGWRPVFTALGVAPAELDDTLARASSGDAARQLLVRLFNGARGDAPAALILEDAHWLDSASWALAAEIQRSAPSLLILLVVRPIASGEMSEESRRLLEHPDVHTLQLDVLADQDAIELACRRLDVDELPPQLATLISERGEGHPLFTEQLVRMLLDGGLIRVADHECRVDSRLAVPALPETVQGLIRGRIDLLAPEEQLTLKIASVFGRSFDLAGLREIHPFGDEATLGRQIARMTDLGLLETSAQGGPASACAFKHVLIREVAYATLSFEQRRRLHGSAAEWYERAVDDDPGRYPVLALHWSEAGVVAKSLWYLERSGEQALRSGNHRETVDLLEQALAEARDASETLVPAARRGTWLRQLGQALHALGRLDQARAHLESAARTLGYPVPASRSGRALATVRAALSPWISRSRRPALDPGADPAGVAIYEAAQALDTVSQIYYLNQDTVATAYCIARRFELLGRLVPTGLFARCSSEMAFLWEYGGIHRRADHLFEQGWETANALADPLAAARILFSWSVFGLGRGTWDECKSRARRSAEIYERLGEVRLGRDSRFIEPYVNSFIGALHESADQYEALLSEASQHDDLVHVAWACTGLGRIRHRQGRSAEAIRCLDRGLDAARASGEGVTRLRLLATRASVRAVEGDYQRAAEDIREATPRIEATRVPSSFLVTEAFAGVAEAALTMLRADRCPLPRPELERAAQAACSALQRGAKVFPSVRLPARVWGGVLEQVRGRRKRAERCWREALEVGATGLPFEEALAHLELGLQADPRDSGRAKHLAYAREVFVRLGAQRELDRVERAAALTRTITPA